MLDWERAEQEDRESWERLLERLRQRGLSADRGLKLIVSDGSEGLAAALEMVHLGPGVRHQLCVFHKLRNIGKAVKTALEESKEAAVIYQGQDQAEITSRRYEFVAKWQEAEPEAVSTLLQDFDKTTAYVEVAAEAATRSNWWPPELTPPRFTQSAAQYPNNHPLDKRHRAQTMNHVDKIQSMGQPRGGVLKQIGLQQMVGQGTQ